MGALAEATIPPGKRWIPKGMEVAYTAKADSDIRCIAETDPEQWTGFAFGLGLTRLVMMRSRTSQISFCSSKTCAGRSSRASSTVRS